ncbi:unnamed protein product [Sphagnum balticum]
MASSGDEEEISAAIDGFDVLTRIGFKWKVISESELSGSFVVSNNSAQPFGVLHGGITAYVAESLASMGAQLAANGARPAGVEMNVAHLQAVPYGHKVMAKAVPIRVGKRIQVWDVTFSMEKKQIPYSTGTEEVVTTAVARLTLVAGLPHTEKANSYQDQVSTLAARLRNNKLKRAFSSKL